MSIIRKISDHIMTLYRGKKPTGKYHFEKKKHKRKPNKETENTE